MMQVKSEAAQDAWAMPPDQDIGGLTWEHAGRTWTEKDRIESEVINIELNQDTYLRGSLLGAGGWSKVYKVRRVRDGEIFAGKSCRALPLMRREAQILKSLKHVSRSQQGSLQKTIDGADATTRQDHILTFVDWDERMGKPGDALLVTELCIGSTLQHRIDATSKGLPGREALEILRHIASALEYLHSSGRFHSDVKPRNILLRSLEPLHAVLGDCADIKHVKNIPPGRARGTPAYFSPEILRFNRCCGTADDMWALGITMLGMVGQWPQMQFTKEGAASYPRKCNNHVKELIELNPGHGIVAGLLMRLLAWNVEDRLEAGECQSKARELRDSGKWGDDKVQLNTPEEFKPVSFW